MAYSTTFTPVAYPRGEMHGASMGNRHETIKRSLGLEALGCWLLQELSPKPKAQSPKPKAWSPKPEIGRETIWFPRSQTGSQRCSL